MTVHHKVPLPSAISMCLKKAMFIIVGINSPLNLKKMIFWVTDLASDISENTHTNWLRECLK